MQEEDRTEFEGPEVLDESIPDSTVEEPETQAVESESRLGRFFRRSLRWIVGAALVFALGILIVFVVRVRPQADQIRSLVRQSDEMQQELSTAQARVEDLEPLQEQNEQLAAQLAESEQHLDLLAVLVDVTNAQLALMHDQPGAAEAALDGTDGRLESLQAGLDGQEADAVEGMRNRLGLVLEGLESDIFAAQRDLEIMANNLVELEQRMFQP